MLPPSTTVAVAVPATLTVVRAGLGEVPLDLRFRGDGGVEVVTGGEDPTRGADGAALMRAREAVCATAPTGRRLCAACDERALAASTSDRRHLVLACGAALIHWDPVRGEPTRAFALPATPEHVLLDEAGRAIAVGSQWMVQADFAGETALQWFHAGTHDRAALSGNGAVLAVADDVALEMWDTARRVRTLRVPLPAPALDVALDRAGERVAVAGPGWHRVYDRRGALLDHSGTAMRALIEMVVGPLGIIATDESGGLVRIDLGNDTVREDAAPREHGFAERSPLRIEALAEDSARVAVRDDRYLRLFDVTSMQEVLRIRGDHVDAVYVHRDRLSVRYRSARANEAIAPATWDLRDGRSTRRPLLPEAVKKPEVKPAAGWAVVTEARGVSVEVHRPGAVSRYAGGLAARADAPRATPKPAWIVGAPKLSVRSASDSVGRLHVIAQVEGAPGDAVVCASGRGESRQRSCTRGAEMLTLWAGEPVTFELVHEEKVLATARWTASDLPPPDAPLVRMTVAAQTTPVVRTREGCRTLLARSPTSLGGVADITLPDGLGLVDRGDGLWTGLERTLTTCDSELSQVVIAAVPAPRGGLGEVLERTIPRASHPGREVTVVTTTPSVYEAEVSLPWDLPRRSARIWLSVRRAGPVAWLVLFETSPQHWTAAREAFAAASSSLTVRATPPSLARATPLRRIEWSGSGWVAGVEELPLLGAEPVDLHMFSISGDEAAYRTLLHDRTWLRSQLPRDEIHRWLDRLDRIPHIALDPALQNDSRGALLGFHAELGPPSFVVHAADVGSGDLEALANEIRARLLAARG